MDKEKLLSYSRHYSEQGFLLKVAKIARHSRKKVLHKAATLYVILLEPASPAWVKACIVGALGYFISPLDTLPDILPLVGFVDDAALMGLLMVEISACATLSVRERAETLANAWGLHMGPLSSESTALSPLLATPSAPSSLR